MNAGRIKILTLITIPFLQSCSNNSYDNSWKWQSGGPLDPINPSRYQVMESELRSGYSYDQSDSWSILDVFMPVDDDELFLWVFERLGSLFTDLLRMF